MYADLARLSDQELEEQVRALVRRMAVDESNVIARMPLRHAPPCLN